jgi:hypothetical protein
MPRTKHKKGRQPATHSCLYPARSALRAKRGSPALQSPGLKGGGSPHQFLFEPLGHILDIFRRPARDVHAEP